MLTPFSIGFFRVSNRVVAGFLSRGNKFFLVRRPFEKKRGGKWEFPGGKVEKGETLEAAIKRELAEELGISVIPKRIIGKVEWSYEDVDIELYLIELEFEGEPELKEAIDGRWLSLREAEALDLCEADRELLKKLVPLVKTEK